MSIEDREWQKARDKKRLQKWMGEDNSQKKILESIYNPKEFRSRKNHNQFSSLKKILIFITLIALIFASYLSENGFTFNAIKTKIELLFKGSDRADYNIFEKLIQSKKIIPLDFAVVQTNFKNEMGAIDVEINLEKSIINYDRYVSKHSIHFDKEGLEGSIVFSIISVDSINGLINGKLNFYMWNAESTNPQFPLNYDRDVCMGDLKRSEIEDDSLKCNGPSAKNIFIYTKSKIKDNIILRTKINEAGLIRALFVNGSGQEFEVGSIRFEKDAHRKKVMMHTLSFQTSISDCDEMPNFEMNLLSVKNNSKRGNSFVVDGDEKFVCFNKTGVKLKDGKIIQSVN